MILFFSGTGNSRWVAQCLAGMLQERLVDMTDGEDLVEVTDEEERLGFVFPVYGWDVPAVVRSFIRERLVCRPDKERYVYLVATCGDDTGRMKERFEKLMREKGLVVKYVQSIQMPNTYVCLPFFDVDADGVRESKLRRAEVVLPMIASQLMVKRCGHFDSLPGSWPWFKTYVLGYCFSKWLITDRWFRANGACVNCGRCVKMCPLKNISADGNGLPRWNGRCAMCLSCYHHCERHAIEWGRATRGKGQYVFRD